MAHGLADLLEAGRFGNGDALGDGVGWRMIPWHKRRTRCGLHGDQFGDFGNQAALFEI